MADVSLTFSPEHIGLPATNPKSLKEWYEERLGCRAVYENPPAYYLELPGGLVLEIYQATGEVDATRNNGTAGWRHLALRVADLDSAKSVLELKGVHFSDPIKPAGGGGRVLFFQDPEGNLLHLVERSADSPFAGRG